MNAWKVSHKEKMMACISSLKQSPTVLRGIVTKVGVQNNYTAVMTEY